MLPLSVPPYWAKSQQSNSNIAKQKRKPDRHLIRYSKGSLGSATQICLLPQQRRDAYSSLVEGPGLKKRLIKVKGLLRPLCSLLNYKKKCIYKNLIYYSEVRFCSFVSKYTVVHTKCTKARANISIENKKK